MLLRFKKQEKHYDWVLYSNFRTKILDTIRDVFRNIRKPLYLYVYPEKKLEKYRCNILKNPKPKAEYLRVNESIFQNDYYPEE